MPIKEREITPPVANTLQFIEGILADPDCPDRLIINKQPLSQEFELTPPELALVVAVLGLIFNALAEQQEKQGLTKRDKRRLIQQAFVDNPPGSRPQWEEEHGKHHMPKGHFPTGRNYSGKQKAIKF